jgi:transposase
MRVIYAHCAGLDVHKKSVVACVLDSAPDGSVREHVRTFGTMTADLSDLGRWLREQQVEQVALESTGVYWWPVFNLLEEEGHHLILVNPQHVKAVPGRKTDVADSTWLAGRPLGSILRHGLLQASFIPPATIRHLRELARYRKALVRQRTQEINRLQKVLESANIKLAGVATDILGVSGRQMLAALADGEEDAAVLADLAKGQLRKKLELLARALEGRVKPHHRLLIRSILAHIEFLEQALEELDAEMEHSVVSFEHALTLLQTIPGVSRIAAVSILAEIGADMGRFASARHLASWAGVCPGNRQSGGKRLRGRMTNGNTWLRGILGEVAWGAVRTKGSAFGARYRRLARRQNKQKALVAVMHNLLVVIYRVLHDAVPYRELGPDYHLPREPERLAHRHVRDLERLGYTVTLTPKEAA